MAAKRKLAEAPSSMPVKLDLACGQHPREGFAGVDLLAPGATKVDLLTFPWPWPDSSVDELHCSHFIEHIPLRDVEERDLVDAKDAGDRRAFLGKDMLFAFWDEAWRVLKPESWLTVIAPSARSSRAFQDPTHRRFIVAETFLYAAAEWRKLNGLDHYRVGCDFAVDANYSIAAEVGLRSPEAQAELIATRWNTTYDVIAKMKALKRQ